MLLLPGFLTYALNVLGTPMALSHPDHPRSSTLHSPWQLPTGVYVQ